jgi:uncharacterized protein (TIGR00661 family)
MNVLVAPLDWGLGHATRCIPVIRKIQSMGHNVFIAGSGLSLELLKIEFPSNKFFDIASYNIEYSNSLIFGLMLKTPSLISVIKKEHKQVADIVQRENIDYIISDNRYGCYHVKVPSAIITHQLSIRASVLSPVVNYFNEKFVKHFTECWVPDTPDHKLSGELSKNSRISSKFIGPLSRMRPKESTGHIRILGLVSGPEPSRSDLEKLLDSELDSSFDVIVRGLPGSSLKSDGIINHLAAVELNSLIQSADIVISRPGYSTVMDLAALKKKAIFVPTPGQTEQLYLARELDRKKIALMVSQDDLVLPRDLERLNDYTGFTEDYYNNNLLTTTLREFLD